jgi:hypothetical protein
MAKILFCVAIFLFNFSQKAFLVCAERQEAVLGKPYYYNSEQLRSVNSANVTWDGENGEITAYDVPSDAISYSQLNFETYFVVTDYNGQKGVDMIVAKIEWGFKGAMRDRKEEGGRFIHFNSSFVWDCLPLVSLIIFRSS